MYDNLRIWVVYKLIKHHQFHILFHQSSISLFTTIKFQIIISVKKHYRFSRSHILPTITSRRQSSILLMNYFNTIILYRILITYHSTIIRTAVIHQDYLNFPHTLSNTTFNTLPQKLFRYFIYRNNDTYFRIYHFTQTI